MDNKAPIKRLFAEVLNQGRLDLLDELIGEAYTEPNPVPGQLSGAPGIKAKLQTLRRAFPDLRFILEDLIGEGERVAARYHWEGTQQGEFMGLQPTGKKVSVRGMDFYRLQNGRIVEHWDNVDEIGLLRQLGAIAS
jgi:steroid delta-isomerase-like uncharacterized protein